MDSRMIYHGHGVPPSDEVLYTNYFHDIVGSENVAIECGAANFGISTYIFEKYFGWACMNLEASKYAFKQLEENRVLACNYNIALSNKDGTAIFRDIVSAPGGGNDNGSLTHTEAHLKELKGYGCVFDEYAVTTVTYKTLISMPVRLLVLDIEGHELQAIWGMSGSAFLPQVVCVEYPISGFDNIFNAMTSLGYKYNFTSCNNAYYSFIEKDSWFGATERMKDIQ